ncbi:hypothetical protein AAZX31_07G208000 [Glycine max]
MEEVCLNSEPLFDERNEVDVEGNSSIAEHDLESLNSQTNNSPLPTVGLEFDSFDECYRAKLSCSSAGFKKKSEANNPRPKTRTGCPAMIVIRMVESKRWRIVEVELQHDHQVSPQSKRFYKSHKEMILEASKSRPLPEPVTEVHTIRFHDTNFDKLKYLEHREGDGRAIYNYFCRMKLTDPNLFYLFDIDDDGHLKNVFWADSRPRIAYNYFNDTVTIDTNCLANKYEIPLMSFVGINHHGHSVLLGCGFLGHESVDYFVWIFKAWLQCMLGRPPHVITDQCKPLQIAVARVFPHARHCYSLQYIMQRVPEKLGGLQGYGPIRRKLYNAVYESLKIVEFESSWADMIKCHGLVDNKWLQTLYKDRHLWVPKTGPYDVFDGYVHKYTSFKEFLDKYDLALHRKHLKEAMADLESRKVSFELKTRCNFEVQLAKGFTKEIFQKFQSEVDGMYSCFNTRQVSVNGSIITYIVKESVEVEGNEKGVKSFEDLYETTELDIRCICSLFNYKGYLCKHALNVLNYNSIEEIPSQYILNRWRRDFKQTFNQFHVSDNIDTYNPVDLYTHLFNSALPVLEVGAQSREHYMVADYNLL